MFLKKVDFVENLYLEVDFLDMDVRYKWANNKTVTYSRSGYEKASFVREICVKGS